MQVVMLYDAATFLQFLSWLLFDFWSSPDLETDGSSVGSADYNQIKGLY